MGELFISWSSTVLYFVTIDVVICPSFVGVSHTSLLILLRSLELREFD